MKLENTITTIPFPRRFKTKSTTCILSLAVILLLILSAATAQDKYKQGEPPAYQDLKFKTDLEFAKLLKKDWQKMELIPGLIADDKPKPVRIPKAELTDREIAEFEATYSRSREVKSISLPEPPTVEEPAIRKKPAPADVRNVKTLRFAFFAAPIEINYDPDLKIHLERKIDNESISSYWEAVSRANYNDFLTQTMYYRDQMNLNDWGYFVFLRQIGEGIYPGSQRSADLFTWFMLIKSGYDAKIGYENDRVYLLLTSRHTLYQIPHYTISGKRYYLASPAHPARQPGSLYIYEENYPGADRLIDVKIESSPNIKTIIAERNLKFEYMGEEITITIKYNRNVVDFFEHYPQTDLNVYFAAAVSDEAASSLLTALQPHIEGKSEIEAVNILLHFVQNGFEYKTDGDQFGREKFFFPEETLFYAYCDCEDRAVLFAYLVRNLTGMEVIGLDYPGHVAAAVKFSDDVPGDYVLYKGQKYTICDPTYFDANPGMCMTRFKNVTPIVIPIST